MEVGVGSGIFFGVIVAVLALLVVWVNNGKQMQVQISELTANLFKANGKIMDLADSHHKCENEHADTKAELARALHRIGKLEQGTGIINHEPGAGLVIADLKGVIRVFSPSLTAMFRWLPQEVVGKPITILMPPEEKDKHLQAFAFFVSDEHRATDSSKIIFADAIDKTGNRFKVAISLDGWQVGSEGLITATIRELVGEDKLAIRKKED